jgi:hypothetical protein
LDETDRPTPSVEGGVREAVEPREYRRPQVFRVGPATRLVRGGLFGKAQDGYTGYYMEP